MDTRTEEGVMASVAELGDDIIVAMIAHRPTTLKDCDRIIHLEDGRLEKIGSRS